MLTLETITEAVFPSKQLQVIHSAVSDNEATNLALIFVTRLIFRQRS